MKQKEQWRLRAEDEGTGRRAQSCGKGTDLILSASGGLNRGYDVMDSLWEKGHSSLGGGMAVTKCACFEGYPQSLSLPLIV